MKRFVILLFLAFAPLLRAATVSTGNPATTNNDDSCDIAPYPAATLLLPYFEVDFASPASVARTTLFTIVNTTRTPQIANVTIWTDWSFPIISFDVFLTGYDVQALNLYDVLARGIIAPPNGTSITTTPGSRSASNNSNPNFLQSAETNCRNMVGVIPSILTADLRAALTTGTYSLCGGQRVGGTHTNAIGYATIDVVATCSPKMPDDPTYFNEVLFDNVLTGDYQQLNPNQATGNYASGEPLVHIRAIPEGGVAGIAATTGLPYTFYDRFTPAATRKLDRRQPLPSTFAARFIQGGPAAFNTDLQIWREGLTRPGAACADLDDNGSMPIADAVRFDERENPSTYPPPPLILAPPLRVDLPATASVATASSLFPMNASGDVAGWLYLNLNNGGSSAYSATAGRDFTTNTSTITGPRQSQNWVTLTMSAEGRFSATMAATQLGNGCTPAPAGDLLIRPGSTVPAIGPAPNVTP